MMRLDMPDEPEPTQQPPPSFGQDSDDAWADVIGRLQKVRPPDPPLEAIDRIWAKVEQRIDDASNPVVKTLLGVELHEPEPAAIERIWYRISRRIIGPRPAPLARAGNRIHWGWALASLILVFALLLGTVNTVAASALPGEELYPAKRAFEAVRWSLALSPHSQAELALVFAERRQSEAEQLVSLGAPTQLVSETLDEALTNLIIATPSLPPQVITYRVDQLRSAVQAWPPSYQVAVSASVSGRLERINKMMSGLNGIAPSPTSRPKSPIQDTPTPTPTATPTPTSTQTPESLQIVAPSTATPTPTQTPSLTPTPTQTLLPTFTSTPTKTSKPRVRPTEKPTQKPPTETSVPPTQPPPTKPPEPTATPAPKPTDTPYPYP